MTQSDLDPLLHQPIRTRLAAYLAARGQATFTELKQVLEVTDGNLEGHIKKLLAAGYLLANKQQGKGRPQTLYLLSDQGRQALQNYIHTLQTLFAQAQESPDQDTTESAHLSGANPQTT